MCLNFRQVFHIIYVSYRSRIRIFITLAKIIRFSFRIAFTKWFDLLIDLASKNKGLKISDF